VISKKINLVRFFLLPLYIRVITMIHKIPVTQILMGTAGHHQ
jgi:hypothetical protein